MLNKKTLYGLNLSVFMMMLGVGMISSLLPHRVLSLTGANFAVSYITSAFAVSYIILQIPIGTLSDRYGFKLFLVAGYLMCCAAGMVYYFSDRAALIFVGRIVQGAGEAPVWALAPALLSIKFPDAKGKVMGIYNAVLHSGLMFGPILGIAVLKFCTESTAFLLYAVGCLTGAVIIYCLVDRADSSNNAGKETISIKHIVMLASDRTIFAALSGITLYGAGYGLFLTVIPAFLLSTKGCSQLFVQVIFSLFYAAISLSQAITGPLSDKFGREWFMVLGLAVAALGIGIFPNLDTPMISVLLTVAGLGLGIFYISSMTFLNNTAPNSLKGTISGAYYLFWGIGYFAGPLIIGKISEIMGSNTGFYAFSCLLVIEVILLTSTSINRLKKTIS